MESDKQYTVDLLTRINALTHEGASMSSYFKEGEYSLWASQQFFLFGQSEEFSKTKDYASYARTRKFNYGIISRLMVMCFELFVVLCTGIEILRIRFVKPKVATFSSDFIDASSELNPRLHNIYKYFHDTGVAYMEIIHITTVRNFFKNIRKRGKLSIYFEALTTIARMKSFVGRKSEAERFVAKLDLNQFSDFEKEFVKRLVTEAVERIRISRAAVSLLQKVIHFVGIEKFISMDDQRYIPEILLACEKQHIPSYVFQHSNFGYLTGVYMLKPEDYIFPTIFFTWNEYWMKRVKVISPFFAWYGERIQIGGRSYTPAQPPRVVREHQNAEKESITILLPYEVSVRKQQITPYTSELLRDPRIIILFVLRGTIDQIDYTMQLDKYFSKEEQGNPRLVVVKPSEREQAIRRSDVIGGVYSGFLDESLETGVPICVFDTDFLNVNRLDSDNLATLIEIQKGDVFNQLLRAYETEDSVLEERRNRVNAGAVDIRDTLAHLVGGK